MGPMIGGAITIQYGLNPPLITLMVAVSFITLPMWWYVMETI
jgi:hypothetical protein